MYEKHIISNGGCVTDGVIVKCCSHDGCNKQVQNNWVCIKHEAVRKHWVRSFREVPTPQTVEQRLAIPKVHTESMVNNGWVLVKDALCGSIAWNKLQQVNLLPINCVSECPYVFKAFICLLLHKHALFHFFGRVRNQEKLAKIYAEMQHDECLLYTTSLQESIRPFQHGKLLSSHYHESIITH